MEIIKSLNDVPVFVLNKQEAFKAGYGFADYNTKTSECVCMSCNEDCGDNIHYVPVLNDTLCQSCYINSYRRSLKKYASDLEFQDRNIGELIARLSR